MFFVAVVSQVLALLVGIGVLQWPYSIVAIFLCSVSWLSYHYIAQPWLGKCLLHPPLTFCRTSNAREHSRVEFLVFGRSNLFLLGPLTYCVAHEVLSLAEDAFVWPRKDCA